jgi:hypothetical protein
MDAGLDEIAGAEDKEIARIKGKRSIALLNDDDEQYDALTQELNRSGAA